MRRPTRRQLLTGSAALAASAALAPRAARAAVAPADRKFLFVWADGGWDVTKVFAPVFSSAVQRDPDDEPAHAGGLRYVANPRRPAVDAFYAANRGRMAVIDGLLVRSANHPICRNLWMTATPDASRPDWPTWIGHARADRYVVPHFVIRGFSMAGALSAYTAISGAGTSLQDLATGDASRAASPPGVPFPPSLAALADDFVLRRTEQATDAARTAIDRHLQGSHQEAARRLVDFQARTADLDLSVGDDFEAQCRLAIRLLSADLVRCVQVSSEGSWDTHADNSAQAGLQVSLFQGLSALLANLEATPGPGGGSLLDETTVVVFSEMGRTPQENSTGGRDHWMYTSLLLLGSGVRGEQQVGGYDPYLAGLPVDPGSGQADPGGVLVTPDAVGATLLTLAGVDPAEVLGADPTLRSLIA